MVFGDEGQGQKAWYGTYLATGLFSLIGHCGYIAFSTIYVEYCMYDSYLYGNFGVLLEVFCRGIDVR